jgi:protein involved in polysaccharide export with SLBB domain
MDELALARTMDEMSYDAYARGREFMRYGRYEAAIDEFQKVLDVDPEHQSARELMEEARLNLEKKSFEEEVAAAELLVDDEIKIRAQAESEERMALRESYHEGERLFREGEFDSSRRKFAEIEEERGRHRRSSFYLRKIDRELWEEKEAERTDFEAEAIRKYTLGPDDVVRVVVRNHPEFDFTSSIEEGGELIIPLTNEIIQADGLTRDDLAETIRQYLTAYIDNPFVNIFITGYGSKKYYVLQPKGGGAEYIMDKASMTLWDVMFRAGIPQLDQAAMRRIQVITPHKTHPTHRWVNVYAMLYQGKMEDNIRIEPGTIIYYPMLAIDKFEMTMKAITRPLKAMVDFQSDYDEFDDWRKEHLK